MDLLALDEDEREENMGKWVTRTSLSPVQSSRRTPQLDTQIFCSLSLSVSQCCRLYFFISLQLSHHHHHDYNHTFSLFPGEERSSNEIAEEEEGWERWGKILK